jgi:hypothetical protein
VTEFHWFELHWPRPLPPETAVAMLRRLATERVRSPIVIEAVGQRGEVRYRLAVPKSAVASAKHLFAALVPGAVLDDSSVELVTGSAALRMTVQGSTLGLRTTQPIESARSLLAALSSTRDDETLVLQLYLGEGRSAHLASPRPSDPRQGLLSQILSGDRPATTEVASRMRERATEHTLAAMVRLAVDATDISRRHALLKGVVGALRLAQSAGTRLEFVKAATTSLGRIPQRGFIQLLPAEIVNLAGWPLGEGDLPGLAGLHPKALRLRGKALPVERVFAETAAPGDRRRVGISTKDSLFHTSVVGRTGSGKSNLLVSLITADMEAGKSVIVIDPKTDLIMEGALPRVPYRRRDDAVILDPLHEQPVGLSPLVQPGRAPELIADSIVTTIRELFPNLFGPRTSDILNASVLSIVGIPGATLTWLPRLLTEEGFRRSVVARLDDQVLIAFWQQFDAMSPAQQAQFVGPVLTRLRQFLLRPQLRRTLDQAEPRFDLSDVFRSPKLLFVPLNSGMLGSEAARLLGSLLVSQLWGLTLGRAAVPSTQRTPVSIYIDEAAEFLRLSGDDLSDALARSRSLGVAWHLAFQYRGQLSDGMQEAIDVNARNRIVFESGLKDAKSFAAQAPELTPEDFLSLPKYHVYANLMRDGEQTGWFSARTLEAPEGRADAAALIARSIRRYGQGMAETRPQSDIDSPEADGLGRRRRPK